MHGELLADMVSGGCGCRRYGVSWDFATPSEAFLSYARGARRLKLFPASVYGPGYLKQLTSVLPADGSVWAVGVGPTSMPAWREAGARAFGLGGDLDRPGQTAAETSCRAGRAVAAAVEACKG